MKQNLENNIKESLKDFELPYDPAAWNAMSKKLDQSMPVSPASNLKWYIGGAAAVVLIAATVAFWPTNPSNENTNTNTAFNDSVATTYPKNNVDNTTTSTDSEKVSADQETATLNNSGNTTVNNTQGQTEKQIKPSNPSSTVNPVNDKQLNPFLTQNNSSGTTNTTTGNGNGSDETPVEILIPTVKNVCMGEVTNIVNKNNISLIIKDPNNENTILKAKKSIDYSSTTEGFHSIGYMKNGQFVSIESFIVMPNPKVDFTVDDQNKYENGIPSIDLNATTSASSYTWEFEKQAGKINGKSVSVHYFNKGNYTVTLTTQGSNGCKSSESKTIEIEDDYNLLAVTAFDPMSNDIRKNTFVPYALTQRSVDFNMIVIDPKDGAIIFETNDATKPWTGLDKRNGQLVSPNKVYIWKVTLNNPVKGEPTEYKGTIIRL